MQIAQTTAHSAQEGTMRTLIGRELNRKTGTEGPQHYPYSYTEWIVETKVREVHNDVPYFMTQLVVLHLGLGTWIEISGVSIDTGSDTVSEEMFEAVTGIRLAKIESYYHRIHGFTVHGHVALTITCVWSGSADG
jgi:hypothetical protein